MADTKTIEQVWLRIRSHEGEEFKTKSGLSFTYSVTGNSLTTDRTEYPIHIGQFALALELVPLDGPGEINRLVRGPTYIWAILQTWQSEMVSLFTTVRSIRYLTLRRTTLLQTKMQTCGTQQDDSGRHQT